MIKLFYEKNQQIKYECLAESLCDTSRSPICPERRPNFDSKTTKNVRLKILSSFLISSLFPFSSDDQKSDHPRSSQIISFEDRLVLT